MILFLSQDLRATGPPVQGVPDFQQHAWAIFVPLMIPKPQHLNALFREKRFPCLIAFDAFRQPVLKTIQLHRQPRLWAIEVEKEFAQRMLAAELEPGEASRL
jgi:hypothetical protein